MSWTEAAKWCADAYQASCYEVRCESVAMIHLVSLWSKKFGDALSGHPASEHHPKYITAKYDRQGSVWPPIESQLPASSLLRKKMKNPNTAKRNTAIAPTTAPPVISNLGCIASHARPIGMEANNSAAKETALSVSTRPALR